MVGVRAGKLVGGWSVSISCFRMVTAEILDGEVLKVARFRNF